MWFSEAGGRSSRCHISRVNLFFSVLFLGPDAEPPPRALREKNSGRKRSGRCFFSVTAILVIFRTFLRPKTRRYTFSRPLPFFFRSKMCGRNEVLRSDRLLVEIPAYQIGIFVFDCAFSIEKQSAKRHALRACLSTSFFDRKSDVENQNPELTGRDLNHLRNKLR